MASKKKKRSKTATARRPRPVARKKVQQRRLTKKKQAAANAKRAATIAAKKRRQAAINAKRAATIAAKKRAPKTKSTKRTAPTKSTKSTAKKKTRRAARPVRTRVVQANTPPPPPAPPVIPHELELGELGAKSYPEMRLFNSAAALLGYFEGRPGVKGVLAAFPIRADAQRAPPDPERREQNRARLEASSMMGDRKVEHPNSYPRYVEELLDLLDFADDGGAWVEAEVDNDSGKSE